MPKAANEHPHAALFGPTGQLHPTNHQVVSYFTLFSRVQLPGGRLPPTAEAEVIAPDFKRKYELAKMSALHPCLSCATGSWSKEEDRQLRELHKQHDNAWKAIASEMEGQERKQCRERWKTLSRLEAAAPAGVQPALVCMCS